MPALTRRPRCSSTRATNTDHAFQPRRLTPPQAGGPKRKITDTDVIDTEPMPTVDPTAGAPRLGADVRPARQPHGIEAGCGAGEEAGSKPAALDVHAIEQRQQLKQFCLPRRNSPGRDRPGLFHPS